MREPSQRRFLWLCLCLHVALVGCNRLKAERQQSQEARAAAEAIQQYSTASDRANQAHKAVLDAFDKANRSSNLTDYKQALRTQVLPAMDTFLTQLQAMPAATAELKKIHALLVDAYAQARRDIDAYETGLSSAEGLGRFADIRKQLQERVRAYRVDLAAYYAKYQRQLRVDAPATGPPGAATPTSLPAASTP